MHLPGSALRAAAAKLAEEGVCRHRQHSDKRKVYEELVSGSSAKGEGKA